MLPEFKHIHCSSRYDRPADQLELDMDDWMQTASIITVTEVSNNSRAATLREKGWGYFNAKAGAAQDDCGIAWSQDDWLKVSSSIRRISTSRYSRLAGRSGLYLYSCSVVLRRKDSGHKLMVTTSHLPAHIQGPRGFKTDVQEWQARKEATLSAMRSWSQQVDDAYRKRNLDGALVCADWNLNLKLDWVQNLITDHWGKNYIQAWKRFPTAGGTIGGGPTAPAGAPGKGVGDRIIDGSLYRGLKVTVEPDIMPRVRSSDHRPYHESFRFMDPAEKPTQDHHEPPHGDVQKNDPWWGFGDYMDDEIYDIDRVFD
jgi:hypothetical protein